MFKDHVVKCLLSNSCFLGTATKVNNISFVQLFMLLAKRNNVNIFLPHYEPTISTLMLTQPDARFGFTLISVAL